MKELMNLYSPEKSLKSDEVSFEEQKQLIEKFFERVNVEVLIDIYTDLKRKAMGWDRESSDEYAFRQYMKHVLQDHDIEEGVPGGQVAGIQPMIAGEFLIGKLVILARGLDTHNEKDFPKFLKIIIHEMSHVASMDNKLRNSEANIGFQTASVDNWRFTPLNEAFTEYITDAVYSEYVQRTGNRSDATTVSYGPVDIQYDREQYGIYRKFLSLLIDEIVKESGFSKEEITRSMLGHYMRADFSREIDDLYAEISPNLQQEFEMLKIDPFSLGNQTTHSADLEKRFLPKLKLICQELLKTREGRTHVEAIFGRDIFGGKKFVAR